MNSLKIAIFAVALITVVGTASSTTLQNIEEIQPVGDQAIQVTGEINLNGNSLSDIGSLGSCGPNQYLNGDGSCTTDQFSPDSNVVQTISATGDTVTLSDGGGTATIDDDTIADNQDIQASRSGGTVTIGIDNGNGASFNDQYSPDSTIPDNQQLSISGHTISLDNGGSVTVPDNYEANTDNQNINSFTGSGDTVTLNLENGGTSTATIDDDFEADTTIADNQDIQASASGDTIDISIDNGNGASATIDDDTIADNQQLSISGDTLSLDNGGSVTLPGGDTIPDDQQLSISGDTISLDNGGSVTIQDDYDPNTDNQQLSLSGNTISLDNGGSITMDDNYDPNTNTQIDTTGASSNVDMNNHAITNLGLLQIPVR